MVSYIGVDLGGTNMRAGRISDYKLLHRKSVSTPKSAVSLEETLVVLKALIRSVWHDSVKSIGLGVPGVVSRKEGIVYDVVNIPHWDEVRLKEILEAEFGIPVHVDNDANCFALAERHFGVGKDFSNFVGLTVGTGLGGGIIQRGHLLEDSNCGSGEFGMIPYKDQVLEYYCSGSFFSNVYGINGKDMFDRAVRKDPDALEAYNVFGAHLAEAIKIVVLVVDPEMIVFGGSVAASYPFFEQSMKDGLGNFLFSKSIKRLKIFFSRLDDPGILGAASLCY